MTWVQVVVPSQEIVCGPPKHWQFTLMLHRKMGGGAPKAVSNELVWVEAGGFASWLAACAASVR
jgi:hypothetical protein